MGSEFNRARLKASWIYFETASYDKPPIRLARYRNLLAILIGIESACASNDTLYLANDYVHEAL